MASIQQSLNQLLGATAGVATAGSYMVRQSSRYQARQADKQADAIREFLDRGATEFAENPEEKTEELMSEELALREKALKLGPSVKRHNKLVAGYEEMTDVKAIHRQGIAESEALQRQEQKIMSARNMLEALQQRKDLLSAKERGQLGTMLGRNKEKGGMDE